MMKLMDFPITTGLLAANVLVFLLVFSMPQALMEQTFDAYSFSSATFTEIWRWVTSIFLHASASHLFFNMLGLFFFGRILEKEVPKDWFLGIYFVSGLLGNLAFMVTSGAPVVGASGAIFGVMGAAMLLKPLKKVHFYIFPLPLGMVAITFAVFEVLVVYFQPAKVAELSSNVAHAAHVGGLVAGAVFAFFHDTKQSLKGVFMLAVCFGIIIILGPVFTLIGGFGGLILSVVDYVIGFFLYGLAGMLSFIWG